MEMQLADEVQDILGDVIIFNTQYPYMQKLRSYSVSEKNLPVLEESLKQLIPNLLITHSETDTEEDKEKQTMILRSIYSNNMLPYYIDINIKQKKKNRALNGAI